MKTKVKVVGPAAREPVTGGLRGLGTGTDIQPVEENQPETDPSKAPRPTRRKQGVQHGGKDRFPHRWGWGHGLPTGET